MSVPPLLEAVNVGVRFGSVIALHDVSLRVDPGEVVCLLGDNGAGKSSLIKILSGVYRPSEGTLLADGKPVEFRSPRDAQRRGIATVFQDLALIPLLSVSRNFFLGNEPTRGLLGILDRRLANRVAREEMERIGIDIRDPSQPAGTLSGGERQCLAIARAVHFGARVLILDEPTSALGVKQAAIVLRYIAQARERGVGVVFITHNVHHALAMGDRFVVLNRGRNVGSFAKGELSRDELLDQMAGGAEFTELVDGLSRDTRS